MTINAAIAITADELLAMRDVGRCELIRGRIIMMTPSSAGHDIYDSIKTFFGKWRQMSRERLESRNAFRDHRRAP